jgi:hypothetical protein
MMSVEFSVLQSFKSTTLLQVLHRIKSLWQIRSKAATVRDFRNNFDGLLRLINHSSASDTKKDLRAEIFFSVKKKLKIKNSSRISLARWKVSRQRKEVRCRFGFNLLVS